MENTSISRRAHGMDEFEMVTSDDFSWRSFALIQVVILSWISAMLQCPLSHHWGHVGPVQTGEYDLLHVGYRLKWVRLCDNLRAV